MSSNNLTVVVMTRDRMDFREKALQSVFDRQSKPPPVIVSDNSTHEYSELKQFQRRYGFSYIRQSWTLTATEHHNVCYSFQRHVGYGSFMMPTSCAVALSEG